MTKKELIEKIKDADDDAEVKVVYHYETEIIRSEYSNINSIAVSDDKKSIDILQ